jgi:cation diffusion facilitator family transporter
MPNSEALVKLERTRQIATVLWVTLVLNWSLAAAKLIFGLITQCMVIAADGLHSLSDGTSNIVGLVAITISGHPADRGHPYGHRKFETLASVTIGFFLIVVSFGILREAVLALVHPRIPQVNSFSFLVMTISLFVNIFVVWYERKKAGELKSDLLLSDSWHTLSDVFVTLSVFVALIGIRLHAPRLDALFTLIIAGVIFITALKILKRGSDVLVDKAVLESGRIETIVRGVEGVRDCHKIRTRGRADQVYVDLHVLVDNQMTVQKSHHLADLIERLICQEIPAVCDVVVHIEPLSHEHEELEEKS